MQNIITITPCYILAGCVFKTCVPCFANAAIFFMSEILDAVVYLLELCNDTTTAIV